MNEKPNSAIRWFPSLTDVAFVMPLIFLFGKMNGTRAMLGDGDTGWHVRIGDWIRANGHVPTSDFFSFTMPGAPFYAWEWLWDLIASCLHNLGGMGLLVVGNVALICLTFALLFRLVLGRCENRFLAMGVTILAMAASSMHWLARPHLITLLFTVLFLMLLERTREESRWPRLLWFPALMIPWTNLHGGFIVGLILIGTYAAGEAIEAIVAGKPVPPRSRQLAWTGVASLAATLVNPYSYHLHGHIIDYLREPYHREYISEFQSVSFHFTQAFYFEVMMLLGVAAALWNLTRLRFTPVLLLILWTHLALMFARNIAIFSIVAAPLVGEALARLLSAVADRNDLAGWLRRSAAAVRACASEFDVIDGAPRVHAMSLVALALIAMLIFAPAPPARLRADYDPVKYPAAAIETLRGNEFSKSIFTHDEWGDYLIYRMYPQTKVFVDGRSDFYGADFGRRYVDVLNVNWAWEPNLLKYGVDTILMPPDAALSGALKESPRWCLVYDDSIALIFRRHPDPQTSCAATFGGGKDVVARSQNPGIDDPNKKGARP